MPISKPLASSASLAGRPGDGYDRVAIVLHRPIAVALLGQIAVGFLLDEIAPRNTPDRAGVINLHKSLGVVPGLLIVAQLAWRLTHRPPASMARCQQRAARWVHGALSAMPIVMPFSGYAASNFSRYCIRFFGTALRPWGPDRPGVYTFFNRIHVVTAWLLCALIVRHVAAALKHAVLDRDDVFARIWPRGAAAHSTSFTS